MDVKGKKVKLSIWVRTRPCLALVLPVFFFDHLLLECRILLARNDFAPSLRHITEEHRVSF